MKFFSLSVVLTVGFAFTQGAFAVTDLKFCRNDVAKFCGDVKKGGGRISKCLTEHASELSKKCKKSAGLDGSSDAEAAAGEQPEAPAATAPPSDKTSTQTIPIPAHERFSNPEK